MSSNNRKTDINDLTTRIDKYYNTIYAPINMMHDSVNSNVIKDIAFSSPYSIQMGTIFELNKNDIVSMFAGASDNDKKKLAEILRTQLKINGSTQYPIKLDYHQIVHAVNTVGKKKDLDGSCYLACFKVFAEKINQKQTKRRTLSTAIGYTSFALGFAATVLTCVGFFLTTAPIWLAYIGLGIAGVFAVVTTATRAINMINRTKNQNNRKIITNLMKQQQEAYKNIKDRLNNFVKKTILSEDNSKQQNLVNNFSNPEENKNKDEQITTLQSKNANEVQQNDGLSNDDDDDNIEDNNADNILEDKNEVNDNRDELNNEINNENNEQEQNNKDNSEFNNNETNVNNGQKQNKQNDERFSREEIQKSRPDLMPIIDLEGKHMWEESFLLADQFFNKPDYNNFRKIGIMPLALWLAVQEDEHKKNEMLEKICKVNDYRMNEINFPAIMALVVSEFHKLNNRPIENKKVQDEITMFLSNPKSVSRKSNPKSVSRNTISEDMKQEFQKVRESFLSIGNNVNAKFGDIIGNNVENYNNNMQLGNNIPRFGTISQNPIQQPYNLRQYNGVRESKNHTFGANNMLNNTAQRQYGETSKNFQHANGNINNNETASSETKTSRKIKNYNNNMQLGNNIPRFGTISQNPIQQPYNLQQYDGVRESRNHTFGANNMLNNTAQQQYGETSNNFQHANGNINNNETASSGTKTSRKIDSKQGNALLNSLSNLLGKKNMSIKDFGKLYNKTNKGINNGNEVGADIRKMIGLHRNNNNQNITTNN